jgi:hypothetical protein
MRLMRFRFLAAGLISAALPVLASGQAFGEYFEYSASVSISNTKGLAVQSGNGTQQVELQTTAGPNTVPISIIGNSSNSAATGHVDATAPNGTDVTFGYLAVKADANSSFSGPVSLDFAYTLDITDYDSPLGGSPVGSPVAVELTGTLSGTIGQGRAVNLSNLSNYKVNGASSALVTIGSANYMITPTLFQAPGPYSPPSGPLGLPSGLGSLGAHIVATVPEPGSVALMAVGGGLLMAGLMRKRLQKPVQAVA